MNTLEIIDEVLSADLDGVANRAGEVEAPCGYWAYLEIEGTWYGVGIDNYGFKTLEEFEDWSDMDKHHCAIDDAWVEWYMDEDGDETEPEFVYADVEE